MAAPWRHCERSEAIHLHVREVTMDCFAALAMTWRWRRTHHRRPRECGGSSTPRLLGSITAALKYWIIRSSAQLRTRRVTTTEYDFAISRHELPEVCLKFLAPSKLEGAGKTGCLLHPRSRARFGANKKCTRAYRAAGAFRPYLRNGFTAHSALSPVNGFLATVAPRGNP